MINYLQSFKWCPLTFSMMYALHFAYFDPIICHKTMKFNGQYQKLLFLFQTDQLFNFISFSITCTLSHTHSRIPVLKKKKKIGIFCLSVCALSTGQTNDSLKLGQFYLSHLKTWRSTFLISCKFKGGSG
jgi:hypothetical protein